MELGGETARKDYGRPEKYPGEFAHLAQLQSQQEMGLTVKKKKKKKTAKDDGSDSEGDNLDLSVDMFPLSHYAADQEELVSQMFATIRGSKLEAMMPPALKNIPLLELKKLCLHELRGMSKKRILCVINGQDMEGSSESELEDEKEDISSDEEEKQEKPAQTPKKTPKKIIESNQSSTKNQAFPDYLMKTIKVEPPDDGSPSDKAAVGGKSVLELLELQMRARIIKTMLEKGDDGKALTEGAIAALIATPAQASQISEAVNLDPKIAKALTSEMPQSEDAVNAENEKTSRERSGRGKRKSEGERHREDDKRQSKFSMKKDPHRTSSRSKQGNKRQRNNEDRDGENEERRSKRDRSSDKSSKSKKKITRREFEERMKRAKKNRTYRQRKSSEDEEKAALKNKEGKDEEKIAAEEKSKEDTAEDTKDDGETIGEKEDGEVGTRKEEGEAASEKEEGECDSDEDEEGACSPSDISSDSYYSSSHSYSSRSRSRSYSRSYSRSPNRRRGSGYGRGKSRSWTRSRSRSRSNDRNRRDSDRWAKKKTTKERGVSGGKRRSGGIVSLPGGGTQKPQKEEEENWGQKCDIEFVDSEEDFDDATTADASKIVSVDSTKKPLPMKGQNSDRANISFSLQKKVAPSITPNVDLDDLPLKSTSLHKRKEMNQEIHRKRLGERAPIPNQEEIINLDSLKPVCSDEILISSDSENEMKRTSKAKSVRVEKRELVHSVKETRVSAKKKKTASPETVKDLATISEKNKSLAQASPRVASKVIYETSNKIVENVKSSDKQFENIDNNAIENEPFPKESEHVQVECSKENEETVKSQETQLEPLDNSAKDVHKQDSADMESEIAENLNISECSGRNNKEKPELLKETLKDHESKLIVTRSSKTEQIESNTVEDIPDEQKSKEVIANPIENESNMEKRDTVEQELKDISCKTKGSRATRRRKNPPSKVSQSEVPQRRSTRIQKVQLDHLQESYDEEQEKLVGESVKLKQEGNMLVKVNTQMTSVSLVEFPQENESTKEVAPKRVVESEEKYTEGEEKGSSILNVVTTEAEHEQEERAVVHADEDQHTHVTKDDNESKKENPADDFYRGADQLNFSDDDQENDDNQDILLRDDREVEPIRIETGLIRKRVVRSQKTEMAAPDKSWTKKEKKKREKPKDVLAMEGIGLLKTTLAESVQSPALEEDKVRLQDSSEGKTTSDQGNDKDTCASWGISSILSKDDTSLDLRIESPKEGPLRETSSVSEDNEVDEEETVQKKIDRETDIIGVIETSTDAGSDQMEGIDLGGSSWSMRWLQSEKVQKVVSSSKMLSRVRKKFQKKEKAIKVVPVVKPEVIQKKLPDPVVPIIGSIEEYERLFGMKAKPQAATTSVTAAPAGPVSEVIQPSASETENPQKKSTSFGSDDEGEDSEEEALWSKILGK